MQLRHRQKPNRSSQEITRFSVRSVCVFAGLLSALITIGCADDKPVYYEGHYVPHRASGIPAAPQTTSNTDASGMPDPLTSSSDPLTSTTDPLTQGGDSLDSTNNTNPQGLRYDYYLVGRVLGGNLTVTLNGTREGVFHAPIDKWVTHQIHKGINTLQLTFEPQTPDGMVDIRIIPGQIDPPLPAVTAFRLSRADMYNFSGNILDKPKTVTRTLTFFVR